MPNPKDQADSASANSFVTDFLRRAGIDGRVNVTITRTRVRLNPDGTRTALTESDSHLQSRGTPSSRRHRRAIALAIIALGLVQMGYNSWAGRSDLDAAPLFR